MVGNAQPFTNTFASATTQPASALGSTSQASISPTPPSYTLPALPITQAPLATASAYSSNTLLTDFFSSFNLPIPESQALNFVAPTFAPSSSPAFICSSFASIDKVFEGPPGAQSLCTVQMTLTKLSVQSLEEWRDFVPIMQFIKCDGSFSQASKYHQLCGDFAVPQDLKWDVTIFKHADRRVEAALLLQDKSFGMVGTVNFAIPVAKHD
ncbi:hypothetical protein GGX14DRAFT_405797 [Mycena pura]|uniref:Uncharacterized protein n=1 Tax=Mycena pura TaxID=153505 RepID=A0AAD6URR6_9AGAR|nr:hypothetical protein GGX14DRAFT_405797 [Mycena pura]